MPELPEVETLRRDLDKEVVGRRVKSVDVAGMRAIRRHPNKKHFISKVEGRKLDRVTRRGKYLLVSMDDETLVIHLGMSGQLLKAGVKDPVAPHTHVTFTFTQGGQLRFIDPRTFGEMFVIASEAIGTDLPEVSELGFDPVEDVMSWDAFGARLRARKVKLKALLMDQRFIAGIGNIYSDEILWAAGLRHDRTSDSLSTQEMRRLYRSLLETLHEAIKLRGSSLSDQQYRDLYGVIGNYQSEHKVYAREGEACRRCRQPIMRARWSQRSTFFCAACQV
ncbi:MAG: bifunctional DNA-formamidopyrimidine glycosylase/DNA-(apurinic or apyrimidinic site) lyase [Actinomycetota bacterium]|jgi:formamidopyrimidine-DNA glycosylase|nr:bifunctional DNA-formamidopyrimidine glycosylase/DNA-(apurinic or apyrimidinic site) lyase [Actinomycetota bacterium]MDQ3353444.1 bifunctional DNA-formamidopyrimidine glycosylase/DNA-(apurinic or apyrimidinic site) lyase [Actinomycetota bacterium]